MGDELDAEAGFPGHVAVYVHPAELARLRAALTVADRDDAESCCEVIAHAADELGAAARLRDLLADEERAVDFATKARYESWRAAWLSQSGSKTVPPPWEELAGVIQRHWRTETVHASAGLLAALREVGGQQ